ncbi:hypothetical protein G6F31_018781 [Rhizopus arrhizus]|nr:hypothetical protein G6F31_018781 [Rhizopus arrhizus]
MQPLGRPAVPDVYSNAHSLSSVGAVSPSGAAKGAAGGASSGPITRKGRPARAAAASRSACRSGKATASAISEWPVRYSSSAARRSGLIGTTDTPSAFNANQCRKNDGRFSSSRPARWPWP